MPTKSKNYSSYFLTLIDDFSRYTYVHFLKQKSEVMQAFEQFAKYYSYSTLTQITWRMNKGNTMLLLTRHLIREVAQNKNPLIFVSILHEVFLGESRDLQVRG